MNVMLTQIALWGHEEKLALTVRRQNVYELSMKGANLTNSNTSALKLITAGVSSFLVPGFWHMLNHSPLIGILLLVAFYFFPAICLVVVPAPSPLLALSLAGWKYCVLAVATVHAMAVCQKDHAGSLSFLRFKKASLLLTIPVAFLTSLLLPEVIRVYRVNTDSMSPALSNGDYVVVNGLVASETIRVNDIVVFQRNESDQEEVKRVTKILRIEKPTGVASSSEKLYRSDSPAFFVVGDNRDTSYDSRHFGAISGDRITGQILTILWGRSRSRIGADISQQGE